MHHCLHLDAQEHRLVCVCEKEPHYSLNGALIEFVLQCSRTHSLRTHSLQPDAQAHTVTEAEKETETETETERSPFSHESSIKAQLRLNFKMLN